MAYYNVTLLQYGTDDEEHKIFVAIHVIDKDAQSFIDHDGCSVGEGRWDYHGTLLRVSRIFSDAVIRVIEEEDDEENYSFYHDGMYYDDYVRKTYPQFDKAFLKVDKLFNV